LIWSARHLVQCISGEASVAFRSPSVPHTRPFDGHFTSRDESPHGHGRPIETPSARHSAGGARPLRQRERRRPASGVTAGGFGRRRGGGVHGPSAASRRPTAARAGRSSGRGYTPRQAPRDGRIEARSAGTGGGGPVSPRQRAVTACRWQVGGHFGVDARLGEGKSVRSAPSLPR
jgi:hypothetical protein